MFCVTDDPKVLLRGTNEVVCGNTARFELEVKQAEPSNYKITWQKVKEMKETIIEQIETRDEKYFGSSDDQLIINFVCKNDKGDYRAVLSGKSNGNTFIVSNKIHLFPIGGNRLRRRAIGSNRHLKSKQIFVGENFSHFLHFSSTSTRPPIVLFWSNK